MLQNHVSGQKSRLFGVGKVSVSIKAAESGSRRKAGVSKLAYVAWTPKGCHLMPTTIAKPLSSISRIRLDVETLKTIIMFCAGGLAISLMCASRGLDLSAGF